MSFYYIALLLLFTSLRSNAEVEIKLTLRNELNTDVEVHWEGGDEHGRIPQGTVRSLGGEIQVNSFPGHIFSYDHAGDTHYITVPDNNNNEQDKRYDPYIFLFGKRQDFDSTIRVACSTTAKQQSQSYESFTILVKPLWSPRGAARFLDLIRETYFDGAALNRVVPQFLTQFGISADYDKRTAWRDRTIPDDDPSGHFVPLFRPGMLSYAGSGPDSRTTEIFVVMPNTPQSQLDYFGTNSWETPFGIVEGNVEDSVVGKWFSYGDMPPWGKGPDPQKIYMPNGYDYLEHNFPDMDYIQECKILDDDSVGEEL